LCPYTEGAKGDSLIFVMLQDWVSEDHGGAVLLPSCSRQAETLLLTNRRLAESSQALRLRIDEATLMNLSLHHRKGSRDSVR
jgi:hypothetical protein